jgi:hypothetical protein
LLEDGEDLSGGVKEDIMILRTKSFLGVTSIMTLLVVILIFLSRCDNVNVLGLYKDVKYEFTSQVTVSTTVSDSTGTTFYHVLVEVFCIAGRTKNNYESFSVKVEIPNQTVKTSLFTLAGMYDYSGDRKGEKVWQSDYSIGSNPVQPEEVKVTVVPQN